MQRPTTSFYDLQQRFGTEEAYLDAIAAQRWPEGFRWPHCRHHHGWLYAARQRDEYARCYRQTSIASGAALHGSRVPVPTRPAKRAAAGAGRCWWQSTDP